MTTLRPFFNYYGSKWRFATRYGAPLHRRLVEPFAGSASYALHYPECQVELVDADPIVAGLWEYLIRVTEDDIQRIPSDVGHVDELSGHPQEARWLVGFWLNKGGTSPKLQRSTWGNNPVSTFWGDSVKARICSQLGAIRHWTVTQGSYEQVGNGGATWFVDPPYSTAAGRIYRYSEIDYTTLAEWCRTREGQVIVCEQMGANWLPFEPFAATRAMEGKRGKKVSMEAVWRNHVPDFTPSQLTLGDVL